MSKEDSFMDSERAVEVLQILASSEDGSYATEISNDYGLDRSTVARLLHKLEQRGLVKEGKTGKAQYYEVDWRGLADFVLEELDIDYSRFEDEEQAERDLRVYLRAYYKIKLGAYEESRLDVDIDIEDSNTDLYEALFVKPALEIPKLKTQNEKSKLLKEKLDDYIGVGSSEEPEFEDIWNAMMGELSEEDKEDLDLDEL